MTWTLSARLGAAAIGSTVLVLPFAILDRLNRESPTHDFPAVLFAVLWLLPFAFVLLGTGVVRSGGAGLRRLLAAACLIVIAWLWGGIVIDQIPCFLGVPNCD